MIRALDDHDTVMTALPSLPATAWRIYSVFALPDRCYCGDLRDSGNNRLEISSWNKNRPGLCQITPCLDFDDRRIELGAADIEQNRFTFDTAGDMARRMPALLPQAAPPIAFPVRVNVLFWCCGDHLKCVHRLLTARYTVYPASFVKHNG
jgi:hypothetical protein